MADIAGTAWFGPLAEKYWKNAVIAKGFYMSVKGVQAIERGVKIHVSANTASAPKIAPWILPALLEKEVFHKVLDDTDKIAAGENDSQQRKFITVYPQSAEQLEDLCDEIDTLLTRAARSPQTALGWGLNAECKPIDGDLPWGRAGYIFVRHGSFTREDEDTYRVKLMQDLSAAILHDKLDVLFVAQRRRH